MSSIKEQPIEMVIERCKLRWENHRKWSGLETADHDEMRLIAEIERLRDALQSIVDEHSGYCEHHVGVSEHSYRLANIAQEALT
jgi:hypothetical protein